MNDNEIKNYKNNKKKIIFSVLSVIFIILFLLCIIKCGNSQKDSNSFENGHHYYIEKRFKSQKNQLNKNQKDEKTAANSNTFITDENVKNEILEESVESENENEILEIEKQKKVAQERELEEKEREKERGLIRTSRNAQGKHSESYASRVFFYRKNGRNAEER